MARDEPIDEGAANSLPVLRIVEREIIQPTQLLTPLSSGEMEKLQTIAEKIGQRQRNIAEHVIASGKDLAEAKDLLGHGAFLRWVQENFGMSARTAQNYMAVAQTFGKIPERVSYLPATTLYRLCEGRTPERAREKVLKWLATGEHPTARAIGNIISSERERVPARETTAKYQLRMKHDRAWATRTKRIKREKDDREWRLTEGFVESIGKYVPAYPTGNHRLP